MKKLISVLLLVSCFSCRSLESKEASQGPNVNGITVESHNCRIDESNCPLRRP